MCTINENLINRGCNFTQYIIKIIHCQSAHRSRIGINRADASGSFNDIAFA